MAEPAPFSLDPAAIRRLVEEVVRRVSVGDAATTRPAEALPAAGETLAVGDAVVTLAHVDRLPAGIRRLAVGARAVITPSARDRAREVGITIVRSPPAGESGPAPAVVPFVIAQAVAGGAAAARAAAIARAVPGSQRLTAKGLTEAVTALALHASRDAARGILLTSRPALAGVVANRSPSLRAVTGRDAATLASAAAECSANLLVVDPAAFTAGLERACAEFAVRSRIALPPELAQAPSGCGCKTHPH